MPMPSPAGGYGMPPKPDSYLVWAILSTVLCCLPLGIVSIVQAAKVDGLYTSGQYDQARQASESAKKWAIISAVVGLVVVVLYILLVVGLGIAGTTSSSSGF